MDNATQMQGPVARQATPPTPTPAGSGKPFLLGFLLVVGLGLLVAGAVGGFQVAHAGMVYPGVRVGDVPVGELTRDRVLSALEPLLAERSGRPLLLRLAGAERTTRVADLGAAFNVGATADAAYAIGRSGTWIDRLAAQVSAFTRGYVLGEPDLRVNRTKLEAYLKERAQEIDRDVKDAELVIGPDLGDSVTPSVVGRKLDVAAATAAVERAVAAGEPSVDLPVVETQPKRVEKDLEEARATVSRMLSGPVVLEFEGRRWTLGLMEIAALMSVEEKVGVPAPQVSLREEPLRQLLGRIAAEIDRPRTDARLDWNGGTLKPFRQGQDGRKLDVAGALAMVKGAISGEKRVVVLPVEVSRAVGGSLELSRLGVTELIEVGRTPLAGVPEKIYNVKLAASRLNGVVVPPGETFSFNKELGPTTLKSGYQVGFGIVSGSNGEAQTVPSVAGGICQVSTTLLQAVFWAGYQIQERYPHMYWIATYGSPPRGMVGLDATVDDPNLDFKFVNNTESYLLIQSKVEGGALEFALYGTKPDWRVEVEGPVITNVIEADPAVVRQEEPTMAEGKEVWVERATDGMNVTILRRVLQGNDVRTLRVVSPYQPSRNVLMVGPRKTAPEPTPTPTATPPAATPQTTSTPTTNAPAGIPETTSAPTTPSAGSPRPESTPEPTPSKR